MSKSRIIKNEVAFYEDGQFETRIKVYQVPVSMKFPEGFKVSCVLLDTKTATALLVLDNHQPFGYHLHTDLPYDKNIRLQIDVRNYAEAIQVFFKEAKKVVNGKK